MAESTPKGGAPYGNRNSFKHGMYRRQEMAAAKERGRFYRDCGRLLKEIRKVIVERIAYPESVFGNSFINNETFQSVFGNFSSYSYKKACGQKKTVRGSKNSRRLSNGTPAI